MNTKIRTERALKRLRESLNSEGSGPSFNTTVAILVLGGTCSPARVNALVRLGEHPNPSGEFQDAENTWSPLEIAEWLLPILRDTLQKPCEIPEELALWLRSRNCAARQLTGQQAIEEVRAKKRNRWGRPLSNGAWADASMHSPAVNEEPASHAGASAGLPATSEPGSVERGLEAVLQVAFAPDSPEVARRFREAMVLIREGQPAFRSILLAAYEGRCAITGFDAVEALEAAHISPYCEEGPNCLSNGLLLRADIHTLFDRGLIAINTSQASWTIVVAPSLRRTQYGGLHGSRVRLPAAQAQQPSSVALDEHRKAAGL